MANAAIFNFEKLSAISLTVIEPIVFKFDGYVENHRMKDYHFLHLKNGRICLKSKMSDAAILSFEKMLQFSYS